MLDGEMGRWAECERYCDSRGVKKVVCKGRVRAANSGEEDGNQGAPHRRNWIHIEGFKEDVIRHRESYKPR